MRARLTLLVAVAALAACTARTERVYFDGKYYPAKARHVGEDRKDFLVSVGRLDQGLAAARAAGRYEAKKYCVDSFGTSDIAWVQAPDTATADQEMANGSLVLRGRCIIW